MERPICYQGQEGYIFISYAHKDSKKVWPILARLQADGFRFWYDNGIDPGSEWDENIAAHVSGCGYFLAFLSENYLDSNNCKDELNFARDQGKPQLLIYLEDVELPSGMAMRMGRNQAIFYNRYEAKEEFFAKLYEAQDIGAFNGSNHAPVLQPAPSQAARIFLRKRKTVFWPMVIAVLLIVAAAAAAWLFWPRGEQSLPQDTQQEAQNGEEGKPVTNVVLADNEQIKVTALDTALDSRCYTLSLAVENRGNSDIYLTTQDFYLDGVYCDPDWRGNLAVGDVSLVDLTWDRETMEAYGIDPEQVSQIEGKLNGRYLDSSGEIDPCPIAYYPLGEENVHSVTYVPTSDHIILVDTPQLLVAATGSAYGEGGSWTQKLVCVNRSQEDLLLETEGDSLNGNRLLQGVFGLCQWVHAGKTAYVEVPYNPILWQTTGYDQVLSYSGTLKASNGQRYPFAIYPQGEQAAQVLSPRQLKEGELVLENDYVRLAYLGSVESGSSNADMFYFQNLTEESLSVDFSLLYENEIDTFGVPCTLDAGQEGMLLSYRVVDVSSQGSPAALQLRAKDITEERTVTIYNPPEEW